MRKGVVVLAAGEHMYNTHLVHFVHHLAQLIYLKPVLLPLSQESREIKAV